MLHHTVIAAGAPFVPSRRPAVELIPIGEATELEVYEAPTFPMDLDEADEQQHAPMLRRGMERTNPTV